MEQQEMIKVAMESFIKKVVSAHNTLINQLVTSVQAPETGVYQRETLDSKQELELRFLEQCLLEHPKALSSFIEEVVPLRTANAAQWSPEYVTAREAWEKRYPLLFPWAFVYLDCIALNINNGIKVEDALRVGGSVKHFSQEEDSAFTFSSDGYSLATDGLKRDSAAFAEAVATAMADNAEKQFKIFKVQGFVPPSPKRNRDSDQDIRLRWLAQYLFLGWSMDKILEKHQQRTGNKFDKSNLSRTLHNLAENLGLGFPEPQPGRRPKTSVNRT